MSRASVSCRFEQRLGLDAEQRAAHDDLFDAPAGAHDSGTMPPAPGTPGSRRLHRLEVPRPTVQNAFSTDCRSASLRNRNIASGALAQRGAQ